MTRCVICGDATVWACGTCARPFCMDCLHPDLPSDTTPHCRGCAPGGSGLPFDPEDRASIQGWKRKKIQRWLEFNAQEIR